MPRTRSGAGGRAPPSRTRTRSRPRPRSQQQQLQARAPSRQGQQDSSGGSNRRTGSEGGSPSSGRKRAAAAAATSTAKRRRCLLDMESPSSALAGIELRSLVNAATFGRLPPDAQQRLLSQFPACDVAPPQPHPQQPLLERGALSNEFLSAGLAEFSRRLRAGEFRRKSTATTTNADNKDLAAASLPPTGGTKTCPDGTFAKPTGPPPVAARELSRRRRGGGGSATKEEPSPPPPQPPPPSSAEARTRTRTLAAVRESLRLRKAAFRLAATEGGGGVPEATFGYVSVEVAGLPSWSKSARQRKILRAALGAAPTVADL